MPEEAKLIETGAGLGPEGEGWFVVNAADAPWRRSVQEDFLVVAGDCLLLIEEETDAPREAYARFPRPETGPAPEGALPSLQARP